MKKTPLSHRRLKRELGVGGATLLGLGSIVGTGAFVSIGLAAGVAGGGILPAILLAGCVAGCNALSSAQLAAAHPVAGGTYEYGYRYLNPTLGFAAGWTFLCAKSASAATAALGIAAYLSGVLPLVGFASKALAFLIVLAVTLLVLSGLRRTNVVNTVIVGFVLLVLLLFSLFSASTPSFRTSLPVEGMSVRGVLEATALMFVAYTGYGRIATLGEEVQQPRRVIPRAIVATLIVSGGLYFIVAFAALGLGGGEMLSVSDAPLEHLAGVFLSSGLRCAVTVAACVAMLGVLVNLVLGLSRVWLAMGRRGDMPPGLALLRGSERRPDRAIRCAGIIVGLLAVVGSVRIAWSLSAFTVLIYYSLTNFAALRLESRDVLYPRWVAWTGLIACVSLAFQIERDALLIGVMMLGAGVVWHAVAQRISSRRGPTPLPCSL